MSFRKNFLANAVELQDPFSFTGKSGDKVNMKASVVILPAGRKPIRITIDAAKAIAEMVKTQEFKDFEATYGEKAK